MPDTLSPAAVPDAPSFRALFTPKLVTILAEGYDAHRLRADVLAGLTVAIVALPLSMAIAIASGTTPDRGLYAAIVGGFLVSALGGSRFQIGGPAGAFIVLVAGTVAQHGVAGMLLATLIAGLILIAIGLLRLGTAIKFVPYPVTVGFTAGIAVIILASQVKELLGLTLPGREPGPLLAKLLALAQALPTTSVAAAGIAALSIAVIVGMKAWRPTWPGMLLAVALASVLVAVLHLPVATIGTRFGGIPRGLPAPALPPVSLAAVQAVLPNAVSFALLGAIESLLSAVVADGMTGRRHRSNCELVAQGVANIASALFGGLCVTGTIARTATNVRSGAQGPVAGMLHAGFLLLFLLVAAPLASAISLAALAGVLAVVAWNMAERHAFAALLRASRGDAAVLLATFLLTIFRDLTEGIVVGFALGALLFINRMARLSGVAQVIDDQADGPVAARTTYDPALATDPDVVVYRITGAFFFGTAATVGAVLDRVASQHRALVIDLSDVPVMDSTAAKALAGTLAQAGRRDARVYLTGAAPALRDLLSRHGVDAPRVTWRAAIADAVRDARLLQAA